MKQGPRYHFWGAITPDEGAFFCSNYSTKVGALSARAKKKYSTQLTYYSLVTCPLLLLILNICHRVDFVQDMMNNCIIHDWEKEFDTIQPLHQAWHPFPIRHAYCMMPHTWGPALMFIWFICLYKVTTKGGWEAQSWHFLTFPFSLKVRAKGCVVTLWRQMICWGFGVCCLKAMHEDQAFWCVSSRVSGRSQAQFSGQPG